MTKTVVEDGMASWTTAELDATDVDTAAGSLTWSVSTPASNGTANVSGSGASPSTFTYQPDANFNGSDSFEVQVSDGNLSDKITINMTVTAVDDAPIIAQGPYLNTQFLLEDSAYNWNSSQIYASDVDTAAGSLTWSFHSGASKGVVTIYGNGVSPSTFTYQPHANMTGSDSFQVQVSDGNSADTVTANIVINAVADAPVITQGAGPLTKTVIEDGLASWTTAELDATDVDTAVGALTWSVSTPASNGTANVSGSGASPTTFTYQPNANFNGSDSFEVQVSDGALTDTIIINVTVTAVDDAPFTTMELTDINATENDPNLAIDLAGLFGDIDNETSLIAKTAESSNPSLVSVEIFENTLILDFQYDRKGNAIITVTGISNEQIATSSFLVSVDPSENNPSNMAYVYTLPFKEREDLNGFYRLQASIMDRGSFAISEGGFLVGKNYDLKSGIRLTANVIDTNDDFFIDLNHTQFEPGKTYYYRAFINNGVKETEGNLRKFKVPNLVDPNAWYAKMEDLGNGWWRSDWLGAFSVHVNGWIYHADLGWVYAVGDDQEGLWLWTRERGWLWTSEQSWPYLWRHEGANWFYFLKQEGKAGVFFDFSSGQYTE